MKEGYILVFVKKEIKNAQLKSNCTGIDVGLKKVYADSLGNFADGMGRKIRKSKHRQAERQRQGHKKKSNLQKNRTLIKETLNRHAKKIINRALSSSKINISVENPVKIGNISRGKLQGFAGAYLARRLQVLGKENSLPVIFVNPWKTSQTCSEKKLTGVRFNIWEIASGFNISSKDKMAFEHPAIFPEKLAYDHIFSWSNVGDVVLDPMCGSGTVLKMAKILKRRFIGIEVHKPFFNIAKKRIGDVRSVST